LCLDVSGLDGGSQLDAGRVVSRDDLERVCERQQVSPTPGDVICIHTGWGGLFMQDNDRYVRGEPGIDEEAARWLTAHDVVAIGADNMAVVVIPHPKHPEVVLPVHQHTLVESGVYLSENHTLDELAANRQYSYCSMLLATKFKGATGCPVRPIAMV
jgi:kynurenine formamidase